MLSGELDILGDNSVSIPLSGGQPARVRVYFCGEPVEIPCSAPAPDQLEFDTVHNPNGWYLFIQWNVVGVRRIRWEADY
jgi:hypothetical protein